MKYCVAIFGCALLLGGAVGGQAASGAAVYKRCDTCHGKDGSTPPDVIKGMGAKDAHEKLLGYRQGTYGGRTKATMEAMAKSLSDKDLQAVAEHVGSL